MNGMKMSQGKVKFYKNIERGKSNDTPKAYTPQYQVLGIEPEQIKSATVPAGTPIAKNNSDNPRTKNIGLQQPLLKSDGMNNKSIPTVGHNRDYTWSGVDHQLIDDLEIDNSANMIDNNDYVSDQALGISSSPSPLKEKNNVIDTLHNLPNQSYILLVQDTVICEGNLEKVQDIAKQLVFGEHEICDGEPVSIDDIVVLKKISIKLGLFLE